MRAAIVAVAAPVLCAVVLTAGSRPPLGLDLYRPAPEDNPLTTAKVALGRQLFFDKQLSRDGSLSCAGCHDPRRAFTDGRVLATGVGGMQGRRNAPTLVNRAWGEAFFWDGRAVTLEQQALEPILNPRELAMTPQAVVVLARSTQYRPRFQRAFGSDPSLFDVARALASYVRTIQSGDAPYDRYLAGDRNALSTAARRGFTLFVGKAGCSNCHSGPLLTDELFHNTGVAWRSGITSEGLQAPADEGRWNVTHANADRGAFKTPTLRQIARTAPYMHNGSFARLEDVIDYYDRGGEKNPVMDFRVRPLHLTPREKRDVLAFLDALSGTVREGQ